jgi:hypothetical protein
MNQIVKKREVVCLYREKDQVSPCTSEQFYEKTKALFTHSVIVARRELVKDWVSYTFHPIVDSSLLHFTEDI